LPRSKIVSLVGDLEARGPLERRRSTFDRRHHALWLPDAGTQVLAEMRSLGLQREDELTTALDQADAGRSGTCFSTSPINRTSNRESTRAAGPVVSKFGDPLRPARFPHDPNSFAGAGARPL